MAARRWSARSRTEKFQIVFILIGIVGAMFFVLEANFFVRIAVLFVGGLIGFGVGTALARSTGGDASTSSDGRSHSSDSASDGGGSSGGGDGGGGGGGD